MEVAIRLHDETLSNQHKHFQLLSLDAGDGILFMSCGHVEFQAETLVNQRVTFTSSRISGMEVAVKVAVWLRWKYQ